MNAERDWHYRYGPKNGIEVEKLEKKPKNKEQQSYLICLHYH